VRAYRCDSGLRCAGRYHEFPVDEALQVACRQGVELPTVDVTLTHLPPSPAVMREKLRRNARLMELDLQDNPGRIGYTAELARTLLQIDEVAGHARMAEAGALLIEWLDHHADTRQSEIDRNLPLLLEYALSRPAGPLTAERAERLSLKWFGDTVPLLWLIARRKIAAGRFDEASALLERVDALGDSAGAIAFDRRLLGGQLALNLAVCRVGQERLGEARTLLRRASQDPRTRVAAELNLKLLDQHENAEHANG